MSAEIATRRPGPTLRSLSFGRSHRALAERGLLGGRWVGTHADAIDMPLLAPPGPMFDAWYGNAPVQTHRHGCVDWVTDGQWLHGVARLEESGVPAGLQGAARQAYADLFEVLVGQGDLHLLRVWNYFPRINEETDGVERYRQFNAGRQEAFIEAGRCAFDGAPAACALGSRGGEVGVQFLAGRQAPVPIENPRQVSAYRYPAAYGPRSPTFSRTAVVDLGGGRQGVFISGTASILGHETVHLGDVRRQTAESLANIETLLQLASRRAGVSFEAHRLTATVYVRHLADFSAVREIFEGVVGATSATACEAVYLQADICRTDLLVEIEAHGFGTTESVA